MSVPSLQSMCLSEMVKTNQWNNLGVNQKDILFSAIANQDNTELFFTAAQQLDLNLQDSKQIYLRKIKSILESFQNNQEFSRQQFFLVALTISERTLSRGSFEDIEEIEQEATKSLDGRKILNKVSKVSEVCEALSKSLIVFLLGHIGIFASLNYIEKSLTGKHRWELPPEEQAKVEPLIKDGSDAIKVGSVLLGVPLALYSISKFTKIMSRYLLKNNFAKVLTNVVVATLEPNRKVNVKKDKMLINLMQRALR